jgi:hypothetical protein
MLPKVEVFSEVAWERMIRAVEKVRERLERAAKALDNAGILYAVAGGNAVAAWVGTIDDAAVRNTRDVDIVLRLNDLPAAITALEASGFHYRHAAGLDMFLDGPDAKARDAVRIVFAGEKVRDEYPLPVPQVSESVVQRNKSVLALEALVRMKLTSYRDKDKTHIRDLIDVGLIDASWTTRFPPVLAQRLQHLLDTPDG